MHRPPDQTSSGPFHYCLFGLRLESELHLPELLPVEASGEPDVSISLAGAGLHRGTLLDIEDVAQFYVDGGARIRIVPQPGVPDRNLRLFLLGSAMGMLLHQRGLLPLHANAVEVAGKTVAFMGPSGSGKSTLAAWFHDGGHRVIADDVCVVNFDPQGNPILFDGLPRLRLWRDALEATGRRPGQFPQSYSGDPSYDKFDVSLEGGGSGPHRLAAAYLLEWGEPGVRQLAGLEAVEAVFANTYRGQFLDRTGAHDRHWRACTSLVESVPMFRWSRDRDHDGQSQLAGILEHIHGMTAVDE